MSSASSSRSFVGGGLALAIAHFSRDLPDHQQLLAYAPATGTRVYAGDGSFIAEYASEHRIITPIDDIPPLVVHAFLAAEDRDFYSHNGVNPMSILRAALADVVRYKHGQRPLGASTITQQLVRHFLLTNEVSVSRKIKEALLAYRIENQLSKNRILEIYLNEIYLGDRRLRGRRGRRHLFRQDPRAAHAGRGRFPRRPA